MRHLLILLFLIPFTFTQDSSSELEFGERPSPDGHHPPFPRFLMHVPRFARKEFFDIVSNEGLSQEEQSQQLTIWAKAFNVTDEFNTWIKQVQEQKEAVTQNVQAVVANISTVYNQLEEILSNTNLTRRDQHDQIRKLSVTFPREVRALFFIARNYRPESRTPVFGLEGGAQKSQNGMVPFGFQQQNNQQPMFAPMPFIFGRRRGGPGGPGRGQGPDFGFGPGPQGNQGPSFEPGSRGGQGPDFGPFQQGPGFGQGTQRQGPTQQPANGDRRQGSDFGLKPQEGRGQGPDFGPSQGQGPSFGPGGQGNQNVENPFAKRQFPRGPRPSLMSSVSSEEPQNEMRRRGPPGPPGGQKSDFGPRPQGPSFGPDFGPQDDFPRRRGFPGPPGPPGATDFGDDFPRRRGPGGPEGPEGRRGPPGPPRGQGPDFGPGGRGMGPDFGPRPQGPSFGPDFGPQNDFTGRRGPEGQVPDFGPRSQDGQGPRFGPTGPPGGRGQGPDFGPSENFSGRRGPEGPEGRRGMRPSYGPGTQDGQGPSSGPGGPQEGRGGQEQEPSFSPIFGPIEDFPGRRGPEGRRGPPGGRGGRGMGPDFGPGGRGPSFGPRPRGPGFGPDFGPQDDFPGRREQGPDFGPSFGPGRRGPPGPPGGRGLGPDFGPQDDFPGRRGQGPSFLPGGPPGGPDFGPGRQGPNFGPGPQGPNFGEPMRRQFDESSAPSSTSSSSQKYFERGMRFDQSSGFGMRGPAKPQQDNDIANNQLD